ncbi:hypothetical protein H257_17734 [Aphanomyces astaci]|uniref:Chitin-binding type-4 domain-containing protein n=1 Tax=Aphanomyces astaci TaxID=112090 RepID=W4FDP9_APHAT|nr:hypothetical protein H257_17734 [Aphanomyces astaci]ETV65580.1 hypothetical protein H257_17734 [Aphanomyces astaci]|eukprot:XP_009844922.1 hypothetical protein H257_17734 [Aphanomyces astaci]
MKSVTVLAWALALKSYVQYTEAHVRDHGLNAGGIAAMCDGKFGVCGDPYSGASESRNRRRLQDVPHQHRENVIGACYASGFTVDLQVQLTANHKGYFNLQWQVPPGNKKFTIQSVLPAGVTCKGDSHCVLRWLYVGWNNPDVNIKGQRQFWNSVDVYISNTCGAAPAPAPPTPPQHLPQSSQSMLLSRPLAQHFSQTYCERLVRHCNTCHYGPTNACFIGLTATHCAEINKSTMCQQPPEYPCAAGKQFFGRGPIQLSWNYNYEDFGKAVNLDLVASPELVATDYDLWNGNVHKVVGLPGGVAKATFIINGGFECNVSPPNRESQCQLHRVSQRLEGGSPGRSCRVKPVISPQSPYLGVGCDHRWYQCGSHYYTGPTTCHEDAEYAALDQYFSEMCAQERLVDSEFV